MHSMLRVATWNVNSVKARKERFLAFLHRQRPDIVCLQELKGLEEIFPLAETKAAGYHAAIHGQRTYNGVALLSREPIAQVVKGFDDAGDETAARFIGGTTMGVRAYSAYIPNGQAVGSDKFAYKLEWMRRLRAYFDARHRPNEKILLAGDFNVAPEDRDVYDPEAWRGQILFSEPEKAALAKICGFGFQDTFRKFHEEGGHYSWWDYRQLGFPKNRGLRIDFIFATAPLWERCSAASIEREERKGTLPSDHAPVLAEFDG